MLNHSIFVEEHLPHYSATGGEVLEAKKQQHGYFKRISEEDKERGAREGVGLHIRAVPCLEVETIAEDYHVDRLVVGFMGHSRIYGRVWRSTSQNVTHLVPCTVIVVK